MYGKHRLWCEWIQAGSLYYSGWLGVHSAIDCQVRASDVRRFRTGDECHHRGDIVNMSIAVECGDGLLWHRPITCGGGQIPIDGGRPDIIDSKSAASHPSWPTFCGNL